MLRHHLLVAAAVGVLSAVLVPTATLAQAEASADVQIGMPVPVPPPTSSEPPAPPPTAQVPPPPGYGTVPPGYGQPSASPSPAAATVDPLRLLQYREEKKVVAWAVILSLIVPALGPLYGTDYLASGIALGGWLGGLGLYAIAVGECGGERLCDRASGIGLAGGLLVIASYVYGIWMGVDAVRDYNTAVRTRLGIEYIAFEPFVDPTLDGAVGGLRARF